MGYNCSTFTMSQSFDSTTVLLRKEITLHTLPRAVWLFKAHGNQLCPDLPFTSGPTQLGLG